MQWQIQLPLPEMLRLQWSESPPMKQVLRGCCIFLWSISGDRHHQQVAMKHYEAQLWIQRYKGTPSKISPEWNQVEMKSRGKKTSLILKYWTKKYIFSQLKRDADLQAQLVWDILLFSVIVWHFSKCGYWLTCRDLDNITLFYASSSLRSRH